MSTFLFPPNIVPLAGNTVYQLSTPGTAVIVNNDSVELFSYFFLDRVPDFSSGVIFKLMSFTFAMITLPIGTYFFTNAYVFNGTFSSVNPIFPGNINVLY